MSFSHNAGLTNIGNTCFMASVFQCLFACAPFRRHTCSIALDLVRSRGTPTTLLEHLSCLFLHMELTQHSFVSPAEVHGRLPDPYNGYQQQDAAEFLHVLIDALHDSDVTSIFEMKTHQSVRCDVCSKERTKEDVSLLLDVSFHDHTLEDQPPASRTLQSLLDQGFLPETLMGRDKYKCETCKNLTNARRTVIISKTPSILVLALKRFFFDTTLQLQRKIMTHVLISPTITLPTTEVSYTLRAIVVHSGDSAQAGHYVAVQKVGDATYIFNDEHVSEGGLSSLDTRSTPYLLLYEKSGSVQDAELDAVQRIIEEQATNRVVTEWVQGRDRCQAPLGLVDVMPSSPKGNEGKIEVEKKVRMLSDDGSSGVSETNVIPLDRPDHRVNRKTDVKKRGARLPVLPESDSTGVSDDDSDNIPCPSARKYLGRTKMLDNCYRCDACGAFTIQSELGKCCCFGKNILDPSVFPPLPDEFTVLLDNVPGFARVSRSFNNQLSFVTIGTKSALRDKNINASSWVTPQGAPQMYGLHGRTFHYTPDIDHRRNRFYMCAGPVEELYSYKSDPSVRTQFEAIAFYLRQYNAFASAYRTVGSVFDNAQELFLHIRDPPSNRREPFILFSCDGDPEVAPLLTYLLYPIKGGVRSYTPMHACGETGSYPLMFPLGHGGWRVEGTNVTTYVEGHQVRTIHQYLKYMLYQHGLRLTRYGSLFQQWVLDQFSRWQSNVFHFMSTDPRVIAGVKLRLHNMKDMDLTRCNSAGKMGRPFAVPSSVPDSAAARRLVCRQCLTIIAELGNPHSWITFTCNRSWPEIRTFVHNVYPDVPGNADVRNLSDEDLAHIAVRIYWEKYKTFKALLKKGAFSYGRKVRWYQNVHEFQKRYWPHFHMLVQFVGYDTLTREQLDNMYCARLFFYEECPLCLDPSFDIDDPEARKAVRKNLLCECVAHLLHRIVYRNLRHTCTKAFCRKPGCIRKDGTCEKRFPRPAGTNDTQQSYTNSNGFFNPRRPYPEDAFVVPYNRLVLQYGVTHSDPTGFFYAHNNWDEASGAHSVQYVHEYQHKGPDFTTLSVSTAIENPSLEFKTYEMYRHIGFCECIMRSLSMPLTENSPSCTEVRVHLPNENFVILPSQASSTDIAEKMQSFESLLLRYFWRHASLDSLLLAQYYSLYTLINGKRKTKGFQDTPPVSSIKPKTAYLRRSLHVTSIHSGSQLCVERHCLGLLLQERPAHSFEDCRTVEGVLYGTFAEAAFALGLFSEHNEYELCLREMINSNRSLWKAFDKGEMTRPPVVGQGWKIRHVFITMIMNGASAQKLLTEYAWFMTRDVITRGLTTESSYEDWILEWIRDELLKNRLTLEEVGLRDPSPCEKREAKVRYIESTRVSITERTLWTDRIPQLDIHQKAVFDCVVHAVLCSDSAQRLFFIHARAGSGKTFLCQCISAFLRSRGRIVLASAPSALAASLHMAGTTCHKCFGLPVQEERAVHESSLTGLSYQGIACRVSDLILIDELGMFDVLSFDCVDRLLQDMCSNNLPFGGKVLLCAGDFSQLPPVVRNGRRTDVVQASCTRSRHWPLFCKFDLAKRWRHRDDPLLQKFSDGIANGKFDGACHDGFFLSPQFPKAFRCFTNLHEALSTYINFNEIPAKPVTESSFRKIAESPLYTSIAVSYHHQQAILLDAAIRARVHSHLKTKSKLYVSQNSSDTDSVCTQQWMASVDDSQSPEHRLDIFVGCKLRLVRNFNQSLGLCNGTQVMVRSFGDHFLDVQILTPGEFYGNRETLFRFKFDICHKKSKLKFARRQFPVRSAYAGTVHRFQGQGVGDRGLLLFDVTKSPFCHGQTYVGITRAQRSNQVLLILDKESERTRRFMCVRYSELDIDPAQFTDPVALSAAFRDDISENESDARDPYDDAMSAGSEDFVVSCPDDDGSPFALGDNYFDD